METVPQSDCFSDVYVEQESVPEADRTKRHAIQIKVEFKRAIYNQLRLVSPYELESSQVLEYAHYWADLEMLKMKRSRYRRLCRSTIAALISSTDRMINIQKKEQDRALRMLFQALDKAVNPELPIRLEIWEISLRTVGDYQSRINFVPANRDSIEGLESLRLQVLGSESCAICLEDYDQPAVLVTRLPCSHYFHGDCIALWLHTHRICPLCRFAMPSTPQQP